MNPAMQSVLETLRRHNEPTIDGSYILVSPKPFKAPFLHQAYTPKQHEAEDAARVAALEQGQVVHIAFLREPRAPIPVWVGPAVQRLTRSGIVLVYTVAPSRAQRRTHGLEVVISAADLAGKSPKERKAYVEAVIVNAISSVLKTAA